MYLSDNDSSGHMLDCKNIYVCVCVRAHVCTQIANHVKYISIDGIIILSFL